MIDSIEGGILAGVAEEVLEVLFGAASKVQAQSAFATVSFCGSDFKGFGAEQQSHAWEVNDTSGRFEQQQGCPPPYMAIKTAASKLNPIHFIILDSSRTGF